MSCKALAGRMFIPGWKKRRRICLLQLQQLGLPFGFRSRVIWWEDYLNNNFHQYAKKKHSGNANRYEKRNIRFLYCQENKMPRGRQIAEYASQVIFPSQKGVY